VLRPTLATAPEGTSRFVASATIERDSTVAAIRPEVPPTTRSLEVRAIRPDGSSEVLLWIPRHRPNWPSSYVMRHPVPLPAGSRLHVVMYMSNADGRPSATALTVTMLEGVTDATPRLAPVPVHGN
jgi:hypothetical protein